jgi:hypothetical protein
MLWFAFRPAREEKNDDNDSNMRGVRREEGTVRIVPLRWCAAAASMQGLPD